jgi:hypothetical protein
LRSSKETSIFIYKGYSRGATGFILVSKVPECVPVIMVSFCKLSPIFMDSRFCLEVPTYTNSSSLILFFFFYWTFSFILKSWFASLKDNFCREERELFFFFANFIFWVMRFSMSLLKLALGLLLLILWVDLLDGEFKDAVYVIISVS